MARDFVLEILWLAQEHPILDNTSHNQAPKDLQTTRIHLSITPKLDKHICFPTCFRIHTPLTAPWLCSYWKSPRLVGCGDLLFEMKGMYWGFCDQGITQKDPSIFNNLPHAKVGQPCNVYVTKKLSLWLSWFLFFATPNTSGGWPPVLIISHSPPTKEKTQHPAIGSGEASELGGFVITWTSASPHCILLVHGLGWFSR